MGTFLFKAVRNKRGEKSHSLRLQNLCLSSKLLKKEMVFNKLKWVIKAVTAIVQKQQENECNLLKNCLKRSSSLIGKDHSNILAEMPSKIPFHL